jgi:hypothetical protein
MNMFVPGIGGGLNFPSIDPHVKQEASKRARYHCLLMTFAVTFLRFGECALYQNHMGSDEMKLYNRKLTNSLMENILEMDDGYVPFWGRIPPPLSFIRIIRSSNLFFSIFFFFLMYYHSSFDDSYREIY